jgi:hypothetical protein
VSVSIFTQIEDDYLENELDMLEALMVRCDLVERAFASILKDAGTVIFHTALNNALYNIPQDSNSNNIYY